MGSPFRNVQKLKFEKANRERYDKMPQKTKDSLQGEAWKYGGPFWSPKHQVNVDPEDGVLYNRPIYKDGTMLTYPSLSKPTSRETELNKPPTNRLSIKRETSKINESSRGMKALKTAYDVGSTFLKGGLGVASTMLTPATAYAQGQPMPEFIEGGVDNRSLEEFERDGPIPLPKFKEETPLNIKEEAYEKQNKKMRSDHKKDTGKTLGERQTSGKGSRRVSFACRFGGMAGDMTDDDGSPSKLAMALKKWGFSSKGEATAFCNKNKES